MSITRDTSLNTISPKNNDWFLANFSKSFINQAHQQIERLRVVLNL